MSARNQLADGIAAALPARPRGRQPYKVVAAPREVDVPEAGVPIVMVIRTNVNKVGALITHDCAVWVIEPKQGDAEDDLDEALDDVLQALAVYPGVIWTGAERRVYMDQPAYRIATTVTSPNPYRKDQPSG